MRYCLRDVSIHLKCSQADVQQNTEVFQMPTKNKLTQASRERPQTIIFCEQIKKKCLNKCKHGFEMIKSFMWK